MWRAFLALLFLLLPGYKVLNFWLRYPLPYLRLPPQAQKCAGFSYLFLTKFDYFRIFISLYSNQVPPPVPNPPTPNPPPPRRQQSCHFPQPGPYRLNCCCSFQPSWGGWRDGAWVGWVGRDFRQKGLRRPHTLLN